MKIVEEGESGEEYGALYRLHCRLLWLIGKFRRSRSFPLFQKRAHVAEIADLLRPGNEIGVKYKAHLGISGPDEINAAICEYGAILEKLPPDAAKYFLRGAEFADYFGTAFACLAEISELAQAGLDAALRNGATAGDKPDLQGILAACAPQGAGKPGDASPAARLAELTSQGDQLSRAIIAMNDDLQTVFTLALALFPDRAYRRLRKFYSRGGSGDPDAPQGPLNRYIRNTRI